MKLTLLAMSLLVAAPALAQLDNPPAPPNLSAYATTAYVDNSPFVKSVNTALPDATGNATINTTQFVTGFTPSSPGTVAQLMSNAPCGAFYVGQYAVVSNLFSAISGSNTNEVMRCGMTGTTYYWRPQRTDYSSTITYTGGALTLTPLLTPPVLYLTGTLASTGTITPSTVNAYPGQQFTIVEQGTLNLLSLQIGGLLGPALNLITGGTRVLTYSCNTSNVCGWQGS